MEPAPGNRPAQIEERAFLSVGGPDGEEREEAETRRKADFFRERAMDGSWGGIGGKAGWDDAVRSVFACSLLNGAFMRGLLEAHSYVGTHV